MRNLILLRGCPAVGKSYFLKKHSLEQYTICPDILRLMFQTPVSDINGVEGISQKNDRQVWEFVFQLLEKRMARGELTIIDATHSRSKLINRYRNLCKKYRYRCTVVDFKKPLKTILKQNKKRDKYKYVPEEHIKTIYERLKTDKIPSWVTTIIPSNYKNIENILFDFTKLYKRIVVIGDVHGSFEPLAQYFKYNYFKYNYDEDKYWLSNRWLSLKDLKNEQWKPILGYEKLYKISNYGRIKSIGDNYKKGIIYKLRKGVYNYLYVNLSKNSKKKTFYVHKLVMKHFSNREINKKEVNHIDGNKQNNNIKNLEYLTRKQNEKHCWKMGMKIGRPVIQYDLNRNKIAVWQTIDEASKKLSIHKSSISRCCSNKYKSAGGFIWVYNKDFEKPIKNYNFDFISQLLDNHTFYLFVGDFFDRGIQNVEVFKFMHKLMQNRNVLCLTGNHEVHFHDYFNEDNVCDKCDEKGERLRTIEPVGKYTCEYCGGTKQIFKSKEFAKTLKQFQDASIKREDIKDFYNRLAQFGYIKFHDRTFVITHGGIPILPSIYTATQDYINGIGKYEESDIVDEAFVNNTQDNIFSIHGHRNVFNEPIKNTKRTFNLCDKIEFGRYLRILEITPKRFKQIKIKNNKFNKDLKIRPKFNQKKQVFKIADNEVINSLNKDRDIMKKDLGDDIYSYNFKNSVFKRRKWTKNTCKARGLFIDTKRGCIVARSYDKFFNWGERLETESKSLQDVFKFPVKGFRKYNGFLGILSYYRGEWFIASKSTNTGPFAGYFKDIVKRYLTKELKAYIEKNNVSLVFEVIDPINDPHIIKYDNSSVRLLDVIKNQFTFECLVYKDLLKFGKAYDFEVKEVNYVFNTWEELYKFKKGQDKTSRFDKSLEGWVFSDTTNFQVKYKTRYYKFWKRMRTVRDRIVRKGGDHTEIRNTLHSLDDFTAYNRMIEIPVDKLKVSSIIEIRDMIKL